MFFTKFFKDEELRQSSALLGELSSFELTTSITLTIITKDIKRNLGDHISAEDCLAVRLR